MSAVSEVELAGMFQRIQCVTSPEDFMGAPSGSCMIKAKLTVAAGGLLHSSAGDVALGSAQENSFPGLPPSLNAGLVILNFDGGGAAACCCAEALPIPTKTKAERTAS